MLGFGSWAWRSASESGTVTNVQTGAEHELMRRNKCGKRMRHRRVRKIDFTVNLIYPLFSRCPVSRGHIKPAHKQVLSFCVFGSTPSNNSCALTENNRVNISGFLPIQNHLLWSSIGARHKRTEKQWPGLIIKVDIHYNCDEKQWRVEPREDENLEMWLSALVWGSKHKTGALLI